MMTKSLDGRDGGGRGEGPTGEHRCRRKKKKVEKRLKETSTHRAHSMHPEPMKMMFPEPTFQARPHDYWPVVLKLHCITRGLQALPIGNNKSGTFIMPPFISTHHACIISVHIIYFSLYLSTVQRVLH
jgi:hypothetical protein